MSIVEEYKIGNTTIKIADDACRGKTPEEIGQILKRIMAIGIRIYDKGGEAHDSRGAN